MQLDPSRIDHYRGILQRDPSLLRSLYPRLNRYIPHKPFLQQLAFLLMPKIEGFYGGAARGGKTDALLMTALQYCDLPDYNALILRRTYGQLNLPDSILNRAHQWLARTDARWVAQHNRYEFPSGAQLQFGYLQYFKDVYQYDSASFHCIIFDELTQFLESQYRFLFSRLSKKAGSKIPLRMRSASNPGGVGHKWVKDRFILYPQPHSFFVPAKLTDNLHIDQDSYRQSLAMLDPITRKQREHGDWDAAHEGAMFKRDWFQAFVDQAPADCYRFRYWDLAATAPKPGKDPDYTVGTLMARDKQGRFYIEDVRRGRFSPQGVEDLILKTARLDGRTVRIRMEQEPGASGKSLVDYYVRLLAGFDCKGISSGKSKLARWSPMASQAEHGNVILCNGPWNHDWMEEICAVPDSDHDDQADSAAGAFHSLIAEPPAVFGVSAIGGRRGANA